MEAGALVASRYELAALVDPASPRAWRAHDRHLGRTVLVVFAADDAPGALNTAGHPGRVLDGGIEDGRRFLVVEGGRAADDDQAPVVLPPSPAADATGVLSIPVPGPPPPPAVAAAPVGAMAPAPGPNRSPRRLRGATRVALLTIASFGLGATAVLAYGLLTAPDPRLSGADARVTVPERDPGADAAPTRTLPGVGSTLAPTTTTTASPTTTTAPTSTTTATSSTRKPTTTSTKKADKPTTTTTRRRGRGGDDRR